MSLRIPKSVERKSQVPRHRLFFWGEQRVTTSLSSRGVKPVGRMEYGTAQTICRKSCGSPVKSHLTVALVLIVATVGLAGCESKSSVPASNDKTTDAAQKARKIEEFFDRIESDHAPEIELSVTPKFTEVAARANIEFTRFSDIVPNRFLLPEIMGGGAGWIDFDVDGLQDLYLTNGCPLENPDAGHPQVNVLYRNLDGAKFETVAGFARVDDSGYGQGCAVADFDADGFADLFVANYGQNVLYRNLGDGTFEKAGSAIAPESEQDLSDVWSTSAAWFDVDDDGDLDLYIVNYLDVTLETHAVCEQDGKPVYCGPGKYDGVQDSVLVNMGDGRFAESSRKLGFETHEGRGLAVCVVDLNGDHRPEVYVANDMTANFLFTRSESAEPRSEPALMYREIAEVSGSAASRSGQNEASMGIACADFDGDSHIDLFLTHYYQEKNTLYRNRGNLLFDDESRATRVAATSFETLGFGTCVLDFDRDGFFDVMVANGHVLGPNHTPNAMRPQLLRNTGGSTFDDISKQAGPYFTQEWLGRGLSSCDFDNDGDLDFVATHVERPTALLRNDTGAPGNFIQLQLVTSARVDPVGAVVTVRAGELHQVTPILAGSSYLCSNDKRITIAIPEGEQSAQISVTWPNGIISSLFATEESFNRRFLWCDWGGAFRLFDVE